MKTNRTPGWVNEKQWDSWASKWKPMGLQCESLKSNEIDWSCWFSFTLPEISLVFIDSHSSSVGLHLLTQKSPWFSLTHTAILLVFIYSPMNLLGFHWLTLQSCWSSSWASKWKPMGLQCESLKSNEIDCISWSKKTLEFSIKRSITYIFLQDQWSARSLVRMYVSVWQIFYTSPLLPQTLVCIINPDMMITSPLLPQMLVCIINHGQQETDRELVRQVVEQLVWHVNSVFKIMEELPSTFLIKENIRVFNKKKYYLYIFTRSVECKIISENVCFCVTDILSQHL
jgi:hypothetical protein